MSSLYIHTYMHAGRQICHYTTYTPISVEQRLTDSLTAAVCLCDGPDRGWDPILYPNSFFARSDRTGEKKKITIINFGRRSSEVPGKY